MNSGGAPGRTPPRNSKIHGIPAARVLLVPPGSGSNSIQQRWKTRTVGWQNAVAQSAAQGGAYKERLQRTAWQGCSHVLKPGTARPEPKPANTRQPIRRGQRSPKTPTNHCPQSPIGKSSGAAHARTCWLHRTGVLRSLQRGRSRIAVQFDSQAAVPAITQFTARLAPLAPHPPLFPKTSTSRWPTQQGRAAPTARAPPPSARAAAARSSPR